MTPIPYGCSTGRKMPISTRALNTAVKRDFYTVVGPDGQRTDAVEQMLANTVEGPVKCIIERLDKEILTWEGEDRAILALFVALLKIRIPAFDRDHNELAEQFQRWWAKATPSAKCSCHHRNRWSSRQSTKAVKVDS